MYVNYVYRKHRKDDIAPLVSTVTAASMIVQNLAVLLVSFHKTWDAYKSARSTGMTLPVVDSLLRNGQ